MKIRLLVACALAISCSDPPATTSMAYRFEGSRTAQGLSADAANAIATSRLANDEKIESARTFVAPGIGETVVEVVANTADSSRAFVVDEDGVQQTSQDFWTRERAARRQRFGLMDLALFSVQAQLPPEAATEVLITVATDVPEPQLPYDGTDQLVDVDDYLTWFTEHARLAEILVANDKAPIRAFLRDNGATIIEDPVILPTITASIPASVLRSEAFNSLPIVSVEARPSPAGLLGYAGHVSMNQGVFAGGSCGGYCDGGRMVVGLWERDSDPAVFSGIARNNTRISRSSILGYLNSPTNCTANSDCTGVSVDVERFCVSPIVGPNCTTFCPFGEVCINHACGALQKICVQDHLSWVAASMGMYGNYDYSSNIPYGVADTIPNVPSGTTVLNTGAWTLNFKVGNDPSTPGFDYLLSTTGGASAPFINRSQTGTFSYIDWAGRSLGTFVTAAAGNNGLSTTSTCAHLRNGLCVGWYDYNTYNDLTSHRRTESGTGQWGSNYVNDSSINVESPHLLGPGGHQSYVSGLHMPQVEAATGLGTMEYGYFPAAGGSPVQIGGSSFASPAVLSAAVQALQYEGWLSALAYPMVNKAVLLASTEDANADGEIGKSTTWSSQPSDAEDGAGQINYAYIKQILDYNQYYWADLADSNFVSCGTNCRQTSVAISVPQYAKTRVSLVWQSCLTSEMGTPVINNDLDLVLDCGNPILACGGSIQSTTTDDEIEMVTKPACNVLIPSCVIRIRIKNGATLNSCGSTTTERVGVAWAFR